MESNETQDFYLLRSHPCGSMALFFVSRFKTKSMTSSAAAQMERRANMHVNMKKRLKACRWGEYLQPLVSDL